MPKKKKKSKTRIKSSKKRRKKNLNKNRISKKRKSKTKRKIKKKINKVENSSSELIFKTRPDWIKSSLANKAQYQKKYNESIKNNNVFWKKEGKRITWIKPYKKIKDVKYSKDEVRINGLKTVH